MDYGSVFAQVELALANAKRVNRESRVVVQTLARLRDELENTRQPQEAHGEHDPDARES